MRIKEENNWTLSKNPGTLGPSLGCTNLLTMTKMNGVVPYTINVVTKAEEKP